MTTEVIKRWIVEYLKNRDAFFHNISNIKEMNEKVEVEFKDKKAIYLLQPELSNSFNFKDDDHIGIVCFNTVQNLDFLVRHWYRLAEFKNLTIYFINPDSGLEKKWIIRPHVHSKVTDQSKLKQGLKTMFDMVGEWK